MTSVRTSQETHYVSVTKHSRLILFAKTFAVLCENNTEHTKCSGETRGTNSYRRVLKGFKEEHDAKSRDPGYKTLTYRYLELVRTCRPNGTYLEQRTLCLSVTPNNFVTKTSAPSSLGVLYRLLSNLDCTAPGDRFTGERLETILKEAVESDSNRDAIPTRRNSTLYVLAARRTGVRLSAGA
jgi:hypothetical protein